MMAIVALLAVVQVAAQDSAYQWDAGELALTVPAGWDAPHPDAQAAQPTLHLAQIQADEPRIRPPGAHAITLTIIPLAPLETPLTQFLNDALVAQQTPAYGLPLAVTLPAGHGITAAGYSADGLLYGVGHAVRLIDGRVLIVTGRAAAAGQDSFIPVYQSLLDSLMPTTLTGSGNPLMLGVPAQGALDESTIEQSWTFEGIAGDVITLSAADISRDEGFDVALRLIAPDGREEAANDDQLGADLYGVFDAQLPAHKLEQTGTYTVIVERIGGSGIYTLGISAPQPFTLHADDVTHLEGWIGDAIPANEWMFEGRAGQVFTITMQTVSGSLDPYLKLYGTDGELFAWNDDAADLEMGTTAQITQVELPNDGSYTLQAARYDGAGRYTIIIVATR